MFDYKYPPLEDDGTLILRQDDPKSSGDIKPIKSFMQTQRVEIHRLKPPPDIIITRPEDVATLLKNIGGFDREHILMLHLNAMGKVIGIEEIAVGTASYAPVHPRELIKGAILDSANSIIFVHNHPSGSLEFSVQDIAIAKQVQAVCDLHGIPMHDFMIITSEGFRSMRGQGHLPFDRSEILAVFSSTIFPRITEGSDPDKDITAEEMQCELAVMIAQETLKENCRRRSSPPLGVFEGNRWEELRTRENLLERVRRRRETGFSLRLNLVRDFVLKEASHESINKCCRIAQKTELPVSAQDLAFLTCMEEEMNKARSPTPSQLPTDVSKNHLREKPVKMSQYEHAGPG